MPAPIFYAHKILRLISEARHSGREKVAGPRLQEPGHCAIRETASRSACARIVVSHQHLVEDMTSDQVREPASSPMCGKRCPRTGSTARPFGTSIPPENSTSAVPTAITGLTGRKIIVDNLWRRGPRMAAARSLARTRPRWIVRQPMPRAILAKNIVAAGLADRCTLAAGLRDRRGAAAVDLYQQPTAPANVPEDKLEKAVAEAMDLTARVVIRMHLDLNRPIYARDLVLRPFRPYAGQ